MIININIVLGLVNSLSLMFVIAFLLSLTKPFRTTVYGEVQSIWGKATLAIVFGAIGILGTYYGFRVDGAIANSRAVAVVAAGLLGGPFVGIGAGLIAGVHRYAIDIGGFTALSCMISTVLEGCIGAIFYRYFVRAKERWLVGFWATVIAEVMQMSLILAIARPYAAAVELVGKIGVPMIIVNAIGVSLFILLNESIYRDRARQAVLQSELALRIAEETLPFLRQGFNRETALRACQIIYSEAQVDAVALTSTEEILAHVGCGADHHLPGVKVQTSLTLHVLENGQVQVAQSADDISCTHADCPLQSAVIVPLRNGRQVIGALKLYRRQANSISSVERHLAQGLAKLFSTQLELAEKDLQERLLAKAELKALQAQINPHFMFNALNTIVSFCRTQPETARRLLLHLSDFLRLNFVETQDFVPLSKEIEHVEAYLEIEKARFGSRLEVRYDLKCEDFELPPLILQPLVENAVRHGILPAEDGGILSIAATSDAHGHTVCISDDGVGFDVNNMVASGTGIGLNNVDRRLRSLYGIQSGLSMDSKPGHGTVCTVRIPRGGAQLHAG